MNYDCLYLFLNVAELLFDSFLQKYSACPFLAQLYWEDFCNWEISSKTVTESVINLPVTNVCLGKAIMALLGQGMYS